MFDSPGVPPVNPTPSPGEERRKYVRYPANRATCSYLALPPNETLFPERIQNISAGGVRLVLDRKLDPGTIATLDLYNLTRDFPCRVSLRVAYTLEQPGGKFMLGCAFHGELDNGEVWGLL